MYNRKSIVFDTLKKISQSSGVLVIPVCGNSMYPTLKSGQLVYILSQNDDIEVGDIVYSSVYVSHGVVHRVYKIFKVNGKIIYQTKGDNNKSPDPYYLYKEAIIGKCYCSLDEKRL